MHARRVGLAALAWVLALAGLMGAQDGKDAKDGKDTKDAKAAADSKDAKDAKSREGEGPYGSIADLKLGKPEDAKDMPVVPVPEGAVRLFDGKSLDYWASRNGKDPARWKLVEGGAMQVAPGTGDIVTRDHFAGRFLLHVEFRVPYEPTQSGQGRGNSGVYLQGRYEVQVLDSYGIPAEKLHEGDCGGIYTVAKPPVNACKAPTVWQSYDIEFQAPGCKDGKPAVPAVMTVYFNGVKIHDHVRLVRKDKEGKEQIVTVTTAGMATDPCTPGPILLQDHGHPVQYRNIWLAPLYEGPAPPAAKKEAEKKESKVRDDEKNKKEKKK